MPTVYSCLDTGYTNLTALWAWFWVLRVGHAESQGRFPGRPRFLLEMGVRALFVCFGVGGWVGYYGNIA